MLIASQLLQASSVHNFSIPFVQFNDLATILAIVVLPTPLIPVNKYALADLLFLIALYLEQGFSLRSIISFLDNSALSTEKTYRKFSIQLQESGRFIDSFSKAYPIPSYERRQVEQLESQGQLLRALKGTAFRLKKRRSQLLEKRLSLLQPLSLLFIGGMIIIIALIVKSFDRNKSEIT